MADDKTWQDRWTTTINYLNAKFPLHTLGTHVDSVVPSAQVRESISNELSIGSNIFGENQRKALRGLLLCQRVYYSDLWAKAWFGARAEQYINASFYLDANWRTQSLNHWHFKNEQDILDGIAMFVPVQGVSRERLSEVASLGFPDKKVGIRGVLTLRRKDMNRLITYENTICYDALLPWITQSGITSMRWLMRNQGCTGKAACEKVFGTGKTVWDENQHFELGTSILPTVPKGSIIHMWNLDCETRWSDITKRTEEDTSGYNGHWVVSNGDGTVTGINNGEVDTLQETNRHIPKEYVTKPYTNRASLLNQFRSYNCPLKDGKGWQKGRMVQINPLKIPDIL